MKRRKAGGRRKKGKANLAGGVRQELGTGGPSRGAGGIEKSMYLSGQGKVGRGRGGARSWLAGGRISASWRAH